MVIFCNDWPCGHAASSTSAIPIRNRFMAASSGSGRGFRHREIEQLLRVVLEEGLLVSVGEPLDRLDGETRFVQPASGPRILDRPDSRPLRSEQAAIDAHGLEQQFQRLL